MALPNHKDGIINATKKMLRIMMSNLTEKQRNKSQ